MGRIIVETSTPTFPVGGWSYVPGTEAYSRAGDDGRMEDFAAKYVVDDDPVVPAGLVVVSSKDVNIGNGGLHRMAQMVWGGIHVDIPLEFGERGEGDSFGWFLCHDRDVWAAVRQVGSTRLSEGVKKHFMKVNPPPAELWDEYMNQMLKNPAVAAAEGLHNDLCGINEWDKTLITNIEDAAALHRAHAEESEAKAKMLEERLSMLLDG